MASSEDISCVGCGEDITNAKGKRNLCSEASRHVEPLWSQLFVEELRRKGRDRGAPCDLVTPKMCRKCFTFYEKCTKSLNSLKENIVNVVEGLQLDNTAVQSVAISTPPEAPPSSISSSYVYPPAAKRLAVSVDSSKSPDVVTKVYWKEPRRYILTPRRKKLGKAVARRCSKRVAGECLKDPNIRKYIIDKIGKIVRVELCRMCSDRTASILRKHCPETFKKFTWDAFTNELLVNAPVLMSILEGCTETKVTRVNRKAVMGMCVALLLKHRFMKMCLVQKIISLILYTGQANKQVFDRLQKLNICMSHRITVDLVKTVGIGYDARVLQWRDSLVASLENVSMVNDLRVKQGWYDEISDSYTESTSESSDNSYISFAAPSVSPFTSEFDISDNEEIDNELSLSLTDTFQAHQDTTQTMEPIPPTSSIIDDVSTPMLLTADRAVPSDTNGTAAEIHTFSTMGDNLDTTIKRRYMRTDSHIEGSLHYFHVLAVKDRVEDFGQLAITPYCTCFNNPEKMAIQLLPTKEQDATLKENLIMIVAQKLATYMPFLQFACSDVTTWHKEHKYYKEMSSKSDVVPLGVLLLNENKSDEMVEILQYLHKYVPAIECEQEIPIPSQGKSVRRTDTLQHRLVFGGDQLTVARVRGAQLAMCNGSTPVQRLEGLIPVIQDWHTEVILTEVIWKYYYDVNSSTEHGTLYQLRNKINRTNVPKHPKSNFNVSDDFLETVVVGHILSAALSTLKLSDINGQLSGEGYGVTSLENLWTYTNEKRRAVLHSISTKIVENFVRFSFNTPPDVSMREDGIHNYACQLLSIGLFYLSYKDAIREGDGQRVLECWHYLLPVFHNSGRKNYSNEAIHLLCQYYYDLPPQQAEQLLYSRFINTKGVRGRNIPLDLHQEHLNRLCKDCVKGLGSNKGKSAIVRCSKALGTLHDMLENFDEDNGVARPSGAHHPPSYKQDLNIVIQELLQSKVFDRIPGRKHGCFKKVKDLLHEKLTKEVISWVSSRLKEKYF